MTTFFDYRVAAPPDAVAMTSDWCADDKILAVSFSNGTVGFFSEDVSRTVGVVAKAPLQIMNAGRQGGKGHEAVCLCIFSSLASNSGHSSGWMEQW